MSPFKTKNYTQRKIVKIVYGTEQKSNKLKMQKQSEEDKENLRNLYYKSIRNLYKLKIRNETLKDRIIRDIKKLFE